MKKIIVLLLLVNTFSFAQDVTKVLTPFKSIRIKAAMDVELIPSVEYKIEIFNKTNQTIEILNLNNELVLDVPLLKKFDKTFLVKIYYQPGLRYLFAANNCNVYSSVALEEKFLEIKAFNNAKINLFLNCENFLADLNLGACLTLVGNTDYQNIEVSNKSVYDAFNFKSKKTTIHASSANAAIYVTDFLNASAKLKAEIIYAGNPAYIGQNTFLSNVKPKQ